MSLLSILVRFIQMYKMLCVYNSDKKKLLKVFRCVWENRYTRPLFTHSHIISSSSVAFLSNLLAWTVTFRYCYCVIDLRTGMSRSSFITYMLHMSGKRIWTGRHQKRAGFGWCAPQSQMHPSPSLIFLNYPKMAQKFIISSCIKSRNV